MPSAVSAKSCISEALDSTRFIMNASLFDLRDQKLLPPRLALAIVMDIVGDDDDDDYS